VAETLTSPGNPVVKLARSLKQRKTRAQTGLFLVEGVLHTGEAVAAGWEVAHILYAPDLLSSNFARDLVADQAARGVRCQALSASVFGSIAEKENPQGILALVRQRHWNLDEIDPASSGRGVALISPQDPGNVGTILRTMDAVGVGWIALLDGGVDPFHPSAVRASMGALFWRPIIEASFAAFTVWARESGCRLVGASAHGTLDYRQSAIGDEPWILVLGGEQKGMTQDQTAACDLLVRIPMHGRASSLNLAVAASVLMYGLMER